MASLNNSFLGTDACFSASKSPDSPHFLFDMYDGIPETLLLNVVAWILLLLLFALLRKRAWDYGRLALVQNEKWTQLFYKNAEVVAVEEATAGTSLSSDAGCCSWFPTIFTINKQRVFARCGPDASHYLSFQRHLLVLSAILTLVSVCVILPVNFQGNLEAGDLYTFGHSTISNLDPNSQYLWIHVIISFCFVPLTILIMRRCSSRIPTETLVSSRTIMVTQISRAHRNLDEVRNYFLVRYPNLEIKDVQMAYRIKDLTRVEQQREAAQEAKRFCILNNIHDMKVQPHGCIICCPWKTKNALEYYASEEERLNSLVIEKRREAMQQPLGIAFITFGTEEGAQYVAQSFVPCGFHWAVKKAPAPPDILWENLQVSSRNWYCKAILINVCLFIVLFFLTTPAYVVSLLNTYAFSSSQDVTKKVSPLLSEFLPTLMLVTISALLPVIVAYSDEFMSHWTKSEQNFATMQKTFCFLLFMVLILPSLGLTSAQALIEQSVHYENNTFMWKCIFLPDKGAFFVNYVITSALIGTALELLRFSELAMYVWRLLLAKSSAEKISIQKAILAEFPFGIHYAWTLLIFTTSTVYSLICPLITPFGLLYLCLKHLVDKHNIYFVYRSSGMCGESQNIHLSAVRNVRVAVILLQLIMLAFAILRGGLSSIAIVTLMGAIGSLGCIFVMGSSSCKRAALSGNNFPEKLERYIAPVLVKVHSETHSLISATPDYGSTSTRDFSEHFPTSASVPP